jgi:hypothetical protein
MNLYRSIFIALIVLSQACGSALDNDDQLQGEWLIPKGEVQNAGPGRDGIPALTTPPLMDVAAVTYMSNSQLVVAVKFENQVYVYPHDILDWHEIVNDKAGPVNYAISYCPLTGSGMAWSRDIDGSTTTFGVSGLLYNNNLLPYDRQTQSNWSQMQMRCVNGRYIGRDAVMLTAIETTFGTIRQLYPKAKMVSRETGYNRNYDTYPYGDYRTINSYLLFSIANDDSRLPRKKRVFGFVENEKAMVFQFENFVGNFALRRVEFEGRQIVVFGSQKWQLMTAYYPHLSDGTVLTLTALENRLPNAATDQLGNTWDVFGQALSGPNAGARLTQVRGFMAYWFAWGAFYPDATIFSP